jgi:hypothetical protein
VEERNQTEIWFGRGDGGRVMREERKKEMGKRERKRVRKKKRKKGKREGSGRNSPAAKLLGPSSRSGRSAEPDEVKSGNPAIFRKGLSVGVFPEVGVLAVSKWFSERTEEKLQFAGEVQEVRSLSWLTTH